MATEKRLIIYADELIKCLKTHDRRVPGIPWSITAIQNAIKELTPADTVKVVHGHWKGKSLDDFLKYQVTCSECGWVGVENYDSYNEPSTFNYCPNCGAKMDGGDDNAAD